jgi:hypothetical protein
MAALTARERKAVSELIVMDLIATLTADGGDRDFQQATLRNRPRR